jgi:hypothetical protein
MFRRLSAACALLAVVAIGFVTPSWSRVRADDGASIGAAVFAAPVASVVAGRLRTKGATAGADADAHARRSGSLGLSTLLWLATKASAFAPTLAVGACASASLSVARPSMAGADRTSRGPPAFVTL